MARYFFDILHEDGSVRDDAGVELPSTNAMRRAVARVILDMAREDFEDAPHFLIQIVVRDDVDYALFTATFSF